jgi:hypothetical protein
LPASIDFCISGDNGAHRDAGIGPTFHLDMKGQSYARFVVRKALAAMLRQDISDARNFQNQPFVLIEGRVRWLNSCD